MIHSRLAAVALITAVLAATPALGWEFGMVGDQTFWTGVRDNEGHTQLVFFCSQAAPGMIQLQVFTPEPGPGSPVAVELSLTTSKGHFGPVGMRATSLDGNLTIATTGPEGTIKSAAQSIYAESGEVMLQYYESTWRYPGANRSEAFGAMLDACG